MFGSKVYPGSRSYRLATFAEPRLYEGDETGPPIRFFVKLSSVSLEDYSPTVRASAMKSAFFRSGPRAVQIAMTTAVTPQTSASESA